MIQLVNYMLSCLIHTLHGDILYQFSWMYQVQRDMQKILGVSSVPHYMALVCFLVQQGADTHARNRRGQTVIDMIPKEMAPAIMNFINDVE